VCISFSKKKQYLNCTQNTADGATGASYQFVYTTNYQTGESYLLFKYGLINWLDADNSILVGYTDGSISTHFEYTTAPPNTC
jgi:hypothetical protein